MLCFLPPSRPFPATASAEGAQFNVPPSPTRGGVTSLYCTSCVKYLSRTRSQTERIQQTPHIRECVELIQVAHGQQCLLGCEYVAGALAKFGLELLPRGRA